MIGWMSTTIRGNSKRRPSALPQRGVTVAAAPFEVESLNVENAARERPWLVGEQSALRRLKPQPTNRAFPRV